MLPLLLTLLAAPAPPQNDDRAFEVHRARLDQAIQAFDDSYGRARAAFLSGWDRLPPFVQSSKLPTTRKLELVEALKAERAAFEKSGELPSLDLTTDGPIEAQLLQKKVKVMADFLHTVGKSRRTLVKAYDGLIEAYAAAGSTDKAKTVINQRAALDAELKKIDTLQVGTVWEGTKMDSIATPWTLTVTKRDGDRFEATLSQSRTAEYKVAGKLDGLTLTFEIKEVTKGTAQVLTCTGSAIGNQFIGTTARPSGSRVLVGTVRLTKKEEEPKKQK